MKTLGQRELGSLCVLFDLKKGNKNPVHKNKLSLKFDIGILNSTKWSRQIAEDFH